MGRTVAVTGGSGKLGRAVVAALIEQDWTVVNIDRVPSPDTRARFVNTDLTDYGQVVEALSGIDLTHSGVNAVVHLAAIPGAGGFPNVTIFENNLLSTRGFDKFVIANDDNVLTRSAADLMAEFFPDVEFRAPVEGAQSLINIDKARRLLGWEPTHSWRNEVSG